MNRPNNPCPECGHTHTGVQLAYICIGCPCPVVGPWDDDIEDELPVACVEQWGEDAHDGPGWYYYDEEYKEEGSIGAFDSREEAEADAKAAGYRIDNPEELRSGRILES